MIHFDANLTCLQAVSHENAALTASALMVGISLVVGGFAGATAAGKWREFMLWRNGESFDKTDPYFNKDIGFYVFDLPWFHFMVDFVMAAAVIALIIVLTVGLLFLLTTQRQTYGGLTVDEQVVWSAGQATALRPEGFDADLGTSRLPIGNEIQLDGTAYQGLDGARFALQDDAGLFSPNWAYEFYRPGFFSLLGAPPESWAGLEAKRLDYQDPDSLRRLGGGEAAEYVEEGLPPPVNRALVTPLEVRGILGWQALFEDRGDTDVMSLVTAARTVLVNVNTATEDVLRTIPGVDASTARRIIALRESQPFMLDWQFRQTFNLPLGPEQPLGMLAVGYGTMKLWHNASGPVRLVHWTLTPIDEGGRPWRLDYEITLPRDQVADTALARPTQTPLFSEPPSAGP